MTGLLYKSDAAGREAEWDSYWRRAEGSERKGLYERIAQFYRNRIISRSAAKTLSRHFTDAEGKNYLHAGCGSGGSDRRIPLMRPRFHFMDLSPVAIRLHRKQPMPLKRRYACGDIFRLPYGTGSMDGIFNFGVMEHFSEPQIEQILSEFNRVLHADGRMVLFWPPDFGLSVLALGFFTRVANPFRRRPLKLHPDEVSRIHSFGWIRGVMAKSGFKVVRAEFGPRDLFTYVAIIAEKGKDRGA